MQFNTSIVKRSRTCKTCGGVVQKGHIIIEKVMWLGQGYPIKEMLCLDCAEKYTNPDFIKYLEQLIVKLKALGGNNADS